MPAGGGGAGDFLPLGLAGVGEGEGDGGGGGVGAGVPGKPGLLTREIFSLGLVVDGGNSVFFGFPSSSFALRRPVPSHTESSSSPVGGGGKPSPSLMSSLW